MTACPDANRLAELVDGTLAAAARAELERHLDGCATCTELIGELAWVVAPGITARAWCAASARTRGEILALWRAVIAYAAARHRAGVVLGGVSPDRVMIDGDRVLAIPSAPTSEARYTAPEQLHGAAPSPASDQFALCASLWEALTGKPAFRGATIGVLAVAMLTRPVPPDGCDRRVFAVLSRGLAPDPAQRWPDLEALLAALDRAQRPSRARIAVIASLALAIAAGLAGILVAASG